MRILAGGSESVDVLGVTFASHYALLLALLLLHFFAFALWVYVKMLYPSFIL